MGTDRVVSVEEARRRLLTAERLSALEERELLAVLDGYTGEPEPEAGFDAEDDEAYWAAVDYEEGC